MIFIFRYNMTKEESNEGEEDGVHSVDSKHDILVDVDIDIDCNERVEMNLVTMLNQNQEHLKQEIYQQLRD